MNIKRIIWEEISNTEEDWEWANNVSMFQGITEKELLTLFNQEFGNVTLIKYLQLIPNTLSSSWATIELTDGVIDIQRLSYPPIIKYYGSFTELAKRSSRDYINVEGFVDTYNSIGVNTNKGHQNVLEAVQSVIPTTKTVIIGW